MCRNENLCALELTKQDHIENFCSGKVPGYPAKACICGSDAHSLAEIGQRFAYLKLDVVSIDGLKHALADWSVRVRFPWDSVACAHPRILKLTVDHGFFKDACFEFHPNLTCLVGGTGTGKSTVIEFLRYCFNDISSFEDIGDDTYGKVEKLVGGGGKICIDYVTSNGEEVSITREVSDPLYRGEAITSVKDKNGDDALLTGHPVFFSQGEIVRIAKNRLAQLGLIDRYIDISTENQRETELISSLDTNASAFSEVLGNLHSLQEEIDDPIKGKVAVEKERNRLQDQLKKPIFAEFPKWESEERFISQTLEGIANAQQSIKGALSGVTLEDFSPKALEKESPNYKTLSGLNGISKTLQAAIEKLAKQVDKYAASVKTETEKARDAWNPLYEAKKLEYEALMKQLGTEDVKRAQNHLRAYNKRLGELETVEKKISTLAAKSANVRKERENLLKDLQSIRTSRLAKRQAKVSEWENKLDKKIRIDMVPSGDISSEYLPKLRDMTTGSHAHKAAVLQVAAFMKPWELVQAVSSGNVALIQQQSTIEQDDAQKIVDHLRNIDLTRLLKLETILVSDVPKINFETEPGQYKPIDELATGTKSIVIVSIAMVEGNYPLIIDQPEDSLNTEFIYNQIVKKLRNEKEMRQFVFASHNANIVVSGETDLTHVLTATAAQGSIKSSGGIDQPDTNRFLLLHLEGGPDAFDLRTSKYLRESDPKTKT